MGEPVHRLVQPPGDRRVPGRRQAYGPANADPEPVEEREGRRRRGGAGDDDGGRAHDGGAGAADGQGPRCVLHVWKYSGEGDFVDMPNGPEESNFKAKIRGNAYPGVERNDLVWAHMGPRQAPPPLPDIEANMVPAGEYQVQKVLRE